MGTSTTIITIGSGKGGVGKTCLTAGLAIALARRGYKVVAADLDFGNSNLYSFLGLENRYAGIAEFLTGAAGENLADLVVPTAIPRLGFLPGDGWTPFTANISHNQKLLLLRELKKLDPGYLLLDLGAGSSYTTLDFFRMVDRGIVVTRPEQPAVLSMLVFLKNLLLRSIDASLGRKTALAEALRQLRHQPVSGPEVTVRSFRDNLAKHHPEAAQQIDQLCRRIRPRLVYNMAEGPTDAKYFERVEATLKHSLSLECDQIGFVPYDPAVSHALKDPQLIPYLNLAPRTAEAIDRVASRIVNYWHQPIFDSASLLAEYVVREFSDIQAPPK